jgi:hypothetical protein
VPTNDDDQVARVPNLPDNIEGGAGLYRATMSIPPIASDPFHTAGVPSDSGADQSLRPADE